ncbi:MAG: nucleotidyltransferase family protein [Planctomycetes bacterium]|nr:nucleotidyltransferase family protein [Planctomycetota bacterium]
MSDIQETGRVWAIVPAAGMSRRMGRPKQSLAFGTSTITGTVTRTLLAAGVAGVVVVTRTDLVDRLELPEDARVHVAFNDDADSEMIDSIRIGLAMLEPPRVGDRDGIMVIPGDMPTLASGTCRRCITAYAEDPARIVITTHEGRRGHPIVFPFALRGIVRELKGGLRMLPQERPENVFLLAVEDAGAGLDIDTRDDYASL